MVIGVPAGGMIVPRPEPFLSFGQCMAVGAARMADPPPGLSVLLFSCRAVLIEPPEPPPTS